MSFALVFFAQRASAQSAFPVEPTPNAKAAAPPAPRTQPHLAPSVPPTKPPRAVAPPGRAPAPAAPPVRATARASAPPAAPQSVAPLRASALPAYAPPARGAPASAVAPLPAAGGTGAFSGAPAILPYRSGLPVPPGYHIESRPASGLIWTGAITLTVGYLAGLGVAAGHDFEGSLGWLALPVVGPWPAVAGSEVHCSAQTVEAARKCLDDAYTQATTIAIVAVDGMVQTTGLTLLVAGLLSGSSELVRDDVKFGARSLPGGGYELGVSGRF